MSDMEKVITVINLQTTFMVQMQRTTIDLLASTQLSRTKAKKVSCDIEEAVVKLQEKCQSVLEIGE